MDNSNNRHYLQLIMLYGVIGILIAVYSIIFYSFIRMQTYNNARIECAGQLRMLTQKIPKDILLYQDGKLSKKPIQKSVKLFHESINAITHGGTIPLDMKRTMVTRVPVMDDPVSRGDLERVIQKWEPFRDNVANYLQIKNEGSLRFILDHNIDLMNAIDRAALSIQVHANHNERDLRLYITSAIGLIILSVLVVLFRQIRKYRVTAERLAEIEQLLPICSGCKKIRSGSAPPDDPRAWVSIEEYLRDKKDMIFTHSLCPECMMKYYPDLFKDKA